MVLVECYTPRHIENVATCLRLDVQKLVMVGRKAELDAAVPRYKEVLKKRKPLLEVEDCNITGLDFGDICSKLRTLFAPEDSYAVDLSGGDALTVMALGAVIWELPPEKRQFVRLLRYDDTMEKIQDCIHGFQVIPGVPVKLTVWDVVRLHGGKIYPNSFQPDGGFTAKQLQPLWDISVTDAERFNRVQGYLAQLRSLAEKQMSRTKRQSYQRISIPVSRLYGELKGFTFEKEKAIRDILAEMDRKGVVQDHSDNNVLDFTFANANYKYCLEKAGNVLEVKVLLEARELQVDGKKYFNDCLMGVNIDWDGLIGVTLENGKPAPETRNEIDAVLMHGIVPLFVSCKNGTVDDEEIYKLSVVTRFYGGPHARIMLIVSDGNAVSASLVQRAKDMGVELVTDVAGCTKARWASLFTGADKEEQ